MVIGAVIGGLSTYLLDRRREERDARSAHRITRSEVAEAKDVVDVALQYGTWPAGRRVTWSDTWFQHRGALAASMSDLEFAELAGCYAAMVQLQHGIDAGVRPLSDADRTFLEQTQSRLRAQIAESLQHPQ